MENHLHAMIIPDQIKEFERSKAKCDVICLFGQLSGAHNVRKFTQYHKIGTICCPVSGQFSLQLPY